MFQCDPERVRNLAVGSCEVAGRVPVARRLVQSFYGFEDDRLRQTIAGLGASLVHDFDGDVMTVDRACDPSPQ